MKYFTIHILRAKFTFWIYSKLEFKYNLYFSKVGIEFPYYCGSVIWLYPWRRKGGAKYISIDFSGDGSFGDARFNSLKEIKLAWDNFFEYWEKNPPPRGNF